MNARGFAKLKSSVRNISYQCLLLCIFTLLILCLFSKKNYNCTQKTEIPTSKYKGFYSEKEIASL